MQESVLTDLHLAYRSELLLSLFISLQKFFLSRIITTVALGCNIFFYMRNLFFCDCFCSDSCLNADCEEMRRNGFFDFDADVFGVIVGFFFVYQESESVYWFVHDMDDNLNDIWSFEVSVLVLKWAKTMGDWLDLINKINDYFGKGQLILQDCFSLAWNLLHEASSSRLAKYFKLFCVLMWCY